MTTTDHEMPTNEHKVSAQHNQILSDYETTFGCAVQAKPDYTCILGKKWIHRIIDSLGLNPSELEIWKQLFIQSTSLSPFIIRELKPYNILPLTYDKEGSLSRPLVTTGFLQNLGKNVVVFDLISTLSKKNRFKFPTNIDAFRSITIELFPKEKFISATLFLKAKPETNIYGELINNEIYYHPLITVKNGTISDCESGTYTFEFNDLPISCNTPYFEYSMIINTVNKKEGSYRNKIAIESFMFDLKTRGQILRHRLEQLGIE